MIGTSDENSNDLFKPYKHLVWLAVCYGILLFACLLTIGPSTSAFMTPIIFAAIFSVVVLVAIWSVFGPGGYLKRLIYSHLLGAIALFSIGPGLILSPEIGIDSVTKEILFSLLLVLVSVPPISVAAQIPYWVLRGFCGWQFVYRGQQPARSFNIRDVFTFTLVFALGISSPQAMWHLQNRFIERDFVGESASTVTITRTDGTTYQEVEDPRLATGQSPEEFAESMRTASYLQYLLLASLTGIGSLLSLPIVLFVFRPESTTAGCLYTAVYCAMVVMLFVCIGRFAFDQQFGAGIFLMHVGFNLGINGIGVATPLLISRTKGFQLTSPKSFEKQQANWSS